MTNNARPSDTRVRAALVADSERLPILLAALRACPLLDITAQSGMPQSAGLPGVPWSDDWRTAVTTSGVEAVILARTIKSDPEIAVAAIERGLHVWRWPPLGRSFVEAAEAIKRIQKQPVVYRVASWWEHVAEHAWQDLNWPDNFTPQWSEVRLSTPGPHGQSWRAHVNDAGGGVLAQDGYGALEALVAVRGLPDSVTAATGNYRRQPGDTVRETEDTALVLLRYTSGGTAQLRFAWDLGPTGLQLTHHGATASVTISNDEILLTDASGAPTDQRPFPAEYLGRDLHRFVEWILGNARDRSAAALERHLAVSAILETAYLSARTGHPESPRKFYEVQGWPVPH